MLKAKSPIMKWAKRAGLIMFALVFALNIQVMFNQESHDSNGSVSLMGMELNLFENAAAETTTWGYWRYYESHKLCRCEPPIAGSPSQCTGIWYWSTCAN